MDKLEPVSRRIVCLVALGLLVAGLLPLGGCRICADCEDLAYPTYGGAWQRTNRYDGRVGSLFDPGGAKASTLVSRDAPANIDELEREKQKDRDRGDLDPDRQPMDDPDMEDPEAEQFRENEQNLRDRQLEDIEEDMENELRDKSLDDININIIPGQPLPPVLR